jgi:DNA-binding PadR family transcriptional regulator
MLDFAILGLLHEQEMHGYEIRRRLRDELGLFANISFGSLYPALSRLEKAGSVSVTEETGSGPRPSPMPFTGSLSGERAGLRVRMAASSRGSRRARKVYRITEAGRRHFDQLLQARDPNGADEARSFSLRLAFARHLAPQARLALLERRRAELAERLDADQVRSSGHRLDIYARSLVEHTTEATEHDIAWLDRLISYERRQLDESDRQIPSGPPDGGTSDSAGDDERAPAST